MTRFVLLRLLGGVYLTAFLVAAWQNVALIGSHGLTPVPDYLELLRQHYGSVASAFWHAPGLFWFGDSDALLTAAAYLGAALSLVVTLGYANVPIMAALWTLYLSIVHVGQAWYGFGWEIQLCETGFLAIFLCPLLNPRPFRSSAPPKLILCLFRWLGFRIMLGAGLIKLRGDACWRDLTCLDTFFETQPVPNPLSWYAHSLPSPLLHVGVLWNHFVEVVAPWSLFAPRRIRHAGAWLMITFQLFLIATGNLSFLNWLTIVPLLAFLDDRHLAGLVRRKPPEGRGTSPTMKRASQAVFVLVALLSLGPVTNMLSPRQAMNTSFDPFELVNTYGAFGTVGKERNEIIVQGTRDGVHWEDYEFKVKPGDPARRPPIITPYHHRLDWLMWFAAMGEPDSYPWIYTLAEKLLRNDPATLRLLAHNPFPDPDGPPRALRAMLYRYRFTRPAEHSSAWWVRSEPRLWMAPVSLTPP